MSISSFVAVLLWLAGAVRPDSDDQSDHIELRADGRLVTECSASIAIAKGHPATRVSTFGFFFKCWGFPKVFIFCAGGGGGESDLLGSPGGSD